MIDTPHRLILDRFRNRPRTASEIAEALGMTAAEVGAYLQWMAKHGLVKRCEKIHKQQIWEAL